VKLNSCPLGLAALGVVLGFPAVASAENVEVPVEMLADAAAAQVALASSTPDASEVTTSGTAFASVANQPIKRELSENAPIAAAEISHKNNAESVTVAPAQTRATNVQLEELGASLPVPEKAIAAASLASSEAQSSSLPGAESLATEILAPETAAIAPPPAIAIRSIDDSPQLQPQTAATLAAVPIPRQVAEIPGFEKSSSVGWKRPQVQIYRRATAIEPLKLSPQFKAAHPPLPGLHQPQALFPETQSLSNLNGPLPLRHLNNFNLILADGDEPETLADGSRPWTSGRPDGHAPIGVMGDHTHGTGEVMLSYRYMYMDMDDNRDGTNTLSDADVLQQFPVTPTRMTMQMHMLGAMYAPSNDLTLMVMAPYIVKEMDHITRRGVRFSTNSEGFGDIKLGALYKVLNRNRQQVHFNFGVGFPTGSIDKRDRTPAGPDQQLPYPMQIGGGTFSLSPGVTYLGQTDNWSWGAQAMGMLNLGRNSRDYRLGDGANLTVWGARRWNDWLSTSVRLDGRTWGNITGADSELNPNVIPTADPDRRGGTQLDVVFGINFFVPRGAEKGARAAVEFALPIHRSLDGPQLETDWRLIVGLQAVL